LVTTTTAMTAARVTATVASAAALAAAHEDLCKQVTRNQLLDPRESTGM